MYIIYIKQGSYFFLIHPAKIYFKKKFSKKIILTWLNNVYLSFRYVRLCLKHAHLIYKGAQLKMSSVQAKVKMIYFITFQRERLGFLMSNVEIGENSFLFCNRMFSWDQNLCTRRDSNPHHLPSGQLCYDLHHRRFVRRRVATREAEGTGSTPAWFDLKQIFFNNVSAAPDLNKCVKTFHFS